MSRRPASKPDKDPLGVGVRDRARELLLRLETSGPGPVRVAEELDRLQPALERVHGWDEVRERLEELCEAWAAAPLRGERAQAWLVLVGLLRAADYLYLAGDLAADAAQAAPVRVAACRTLAALGGTEAQETLLGILRRPGDAHVRRAAAEALAGAGNPALREQLQALLDDDLPRPVWQAVAAALERC